MVVTAASQLAVSRRARPKHHQTNQRPSTQHLLTYARRPLVWQALSKVGKVTDVHARCGADLLPMQKDPCVFETRVVFREFPFAIAAHALMIGGAVCGYEEKTCLGRWGWHVSMPELSKCPLHIKQQTDSERTYECWGIPHNTEIFTARLGAIYVDFCQHIAPCAPLIEASTCSETTCSMQKRCSQQQLPRCVIKYPSITILNSKHRSSQEFGSYLWKPSIFVDDSVALRLVTLSVTAHDTRQLHIEAPFYMHNLKKSYDAFTQTSSCVEYKSQCIRLMIITDPASLHQLENSAKLNFIQHILNKASK